MNGETQQACKAGSNRVLTAVGVALCVIFGFLLVCNLTIIIKGALFPEKPPSVLGLTPMVVLSGSMSGEAEDHIEVGDVIAYMNGGTTVTHRITAIDTNADGDLLFTTKGDANNAEDTTPVTEEQLVGIYRWRIPKVGDFALFLQTPLGMLLFVGVPVLAFLIYDIIRRQRYANRENRRTAELEAELERLRGMNEEKEQREELPS